MADRAPAPFSSPPVVAIAGWLIPGSGYLLIGEWARGITIGVTIIGLFLAGLLIAGVRVVEVPGYDERGDRRPYEFIKTLAVPPSPGNPGRQATPDWGWILQVAPMAELRDKPWSVPQAMAGPIALAAAAASVHAAGPDPSDPENVKRYEAGSVWPLRPGTPPPLRPGQPAPPYKPIGYLSHARIADIGSLYLSVAGLLNLMAIIDAAHRAAHPKRPPAEEPA
jgi:hypothetical protein